MLCINTTKAIDRNRSRSITSEESLLMTYRLVKLSDESIVSFFKERLIDIIKHFHYTYSFIHKKSYVLYVFLREDNEESVAVCYDDFLIIKASVVLCDVACKIVNINLII